MNTRSAHRIAQHAGTAIALLVSPLLVTTLAAQERASAEGRVRRPQSDFPEEIKLSEEQQLKLREINAEFGAKRAEWSEKRGKILTKEQRAAQAEAVQKVRAGGMTRLEGSDLVLKAINYTPEQKAEIAEIEKAVRLSYEQSDKLKMAILTDEQRATFGRLRRANEVASTFTLPWGMEATDEQKAGLKALNDELGPKLTQLTEAEAAIMTDERRAARDAALRDAQTNGKDSITNTKALQAALNLTPDERTQLMQTDASLRELKAQIRDRIGALLTPAQKAQYEKRVPR